MFYKERREAPTGVCRALCLCPSNDPKGNGQLRCPRVSCFGPSRIKLYIRSLQPRLLARFASIGHEILGLGVVDWSPVSGQLAAIFRVVVWAVLVQCRDIAIPAAALTVGLRVMRVQVVTARESPFAARNPAYMRLLLRVALHVSLQMLLPLEATLATGLLALELDLLDNRWKVLQTQALLRRLLPSNFPGGLALDSGETIAINWRLVEVIQVIHAA